MDVFFDWQWWLFNIINYNIYYKYTIIYTIIHTIFKNKNLMVGFSIIHFFLKIKIKSDGYKVTDLYDKEIP